MKILFNILDEIFGIKSVVETNEIGHVVMDSRKVQKGDLFFAINNGNNYIEDVLNKGAALVVADNYKGNDKRVIKVENTVESMQKLAQKYREALDIKIIAITGSNGKTTTKDMMYSVLSQKYVTAKTMGNLNNHIGVPFTILQLDSKYEVAVLELGMSGFGEIDLLSNIAKPDIGVITNIGDSHLEFLKTRENVFKAKTELIKYITKENLIIFGDDPFLKILDGIKVGYGDNNNYQIKNFMDSDKGLSFELDENKYEVALNGKHNCLNAAMAVVIGKKMGIPYEEIKAGLKNLELTPMRFQKIEKENIVYINDAYNASPISVSFSLETFDKLYNDTLKIVVLGDMLELGENEIEYHKNILDKALNIHTDKIYLYGERMRKALEYIKENREKITHFTEKEEIKKAILKEQRKISVLLKGSRGMKLEEIIE
ncbi:UDP-N-acetylmuramoyl-tripeptide--D-alanyl-D-alanine ligase [Fusobacterium varium]|uniref:UDP-N-acetylmuramoyl-tripeptide--D-alanyl-D-alanine ligase n=1 Tax=Fusobacterium varium ATCC 27725 TaxID=469618 RepID=A0ABN5JJF7_FUSVA|nr:UDP-N-acetylmuramoyl-tripeptide--D-alanyl-D-alanine ligase [Fusobacterium varium]AVQ30617.1 UDP-N-acetylmuramoyl-tripeptide--D-alanyl-D-alanine ligase [Fusobacterium varium ATCC 27725]EES65321.2 UDP-N-acetylmuramoyl-tripeptide--D-alanyl-D-alanine ligase [Fusobacterium varium ATCC 27725]VEH40777.1 UDP-N-acetylmuramoyl-tripeptide--D-alanyl-D-alanine ligase [Fusobacterium varium]